MKRRDFISLLGGAAAWPATPRAQQPQARRRIGFLGPERRLRKLRQGLAALGYVEGRDIAVEYRPSDRADRLAGFAAELVALRVDVIVASGSQSVRAAQLATRTIPIVMTGSSDPVGTGFVASLARPEGNITGMSLQSPEVSGKRLALLKEIVANLLRVAALSNPDDPPAVFSVRETVAAARALKIKVELMEARRPEDLDGAFASVIETRPGALVVLPASLMTSHAGRIAALALQWKMPSISYFREFPGAGGLISYGPNLDDSAQRAAGYVDKIFNGAKPAELPVEQPTSFEMVINLRTAKALGLTVPEPLVARADDVIE